MRKFRISTKSRRHGVHKLLTNCFFVRNLDCSSPPRGTIQLSKMARVHRFIIMEQKTLEPRSKLPAREKFSSPSDEFAFRVTKMCMRWSASTGRAARSTHNDTDRTRTFEEALVQSTLYRNSLYQENK